MTLLSLLLFPLLQGSTDPDSIAANRAIAIVNVNVIPMDRNTVIRNRTVLIRAGRVEWLRDRNATLPSDAVVIDGRNRYLMPGLIDMHVHARRADMRLYRAAGITTVRNMWGHDGIKQLMHDLEAGTLSGPRIVSASPGLDGTPVQWPFTQIVEDTGAAARVVHEMKQAGWSFIKVYTSLQPNVYDAIVEAARSEGISVIGHVPVRVSIEHVLASGQTAIEHLMGYDRALSASGAGGTFGWADADSTKFDALVSLTKQQRVWNCPTLSIYAKLAERQGAPERQRMIRNRRIFVRRLADAGAPLLVGTDAGIDVVPAGLTLQSELEEFVAAGLTPYRALQAATIDAARFLGQNDIGVVRAGARADLVLLNGNPLDDISATRRISGVLLRGRWLSAAALSLRQITSPSEARSSTEPDRTVRQPTPRWPATRYTAHPARPSRRT